MGGSSRRNGSQLTTVEGVDLSSQVRGRDRPDSWKLVKVESNWIGRSSFVLCDIHIPLYEDGDSWGAGRGQTTMDGQSPLVG